MTTVTREGMFFDVYRELGKALGTRTEPWMYPGEEYEFRIVIDRRWRLHLTYDEMEELYDAKDNRSSMLEVFENLKQSNLEFISVR